MNSVQADIIKDLPSLKLREVNVTTKFLKEPRLSQTKAFDLKILAFMNWNELSCWVENASFNKYFLAKPSQANLIDLEICLECSAQKVLFDAILSPIHSRINAREVRLREAAKINDLVCISSILASATASYWKDHGYFCTKNSKLNRNFAVQNKYIIQNEIKRDLYLREIKLIGTILDLKKAKKVGATQVLFDFQETEIVLQNIDIED